MASRYDILLGVTPTPPPKPRAKKKPVEAPGQRLVLLSETRPWKQMLRIAMQYKAPIVWLVEKQYEAEVELFLRKAFRRPLDPSKFRIMTPENRRPAAGAVWCVVGPHMGIPMSAIKRCASLHPDRDDFLAILFWLKGGMPWGEHASPKKGEIELNGVTWPYRRV